MAEQTDTIPAPFYDAFISYSRVNEKFAKRLEARLERYRPPKGLDIEKRRLNVFRDIQDIKGNKLSTAIKNALRNSRYLIVICSPVARASEWVNREIETFVEFHGAENVIPVILDGRPNNEVWPDDENQDHAFPEQVVKHLGDPLAADFREREGVSKSEQRVLEREALYQLKATLYDVEKEELLKRQQNRTNQRLAAALGVAVLVIVAFAWISLFAVAQSELARSEADRATENEKIAQDSTAEAQRQRELALQNLTTANENARLAEEQRQIALRNAQTALDSAAEAQYQRSVAFENQRIAEENAQRAEEQTQIALANEEEAERNALLAQQQRDQSDSLRQRTLGLALATKALDQIESGNGRLGAILAREAYHFNAISRGEFINEVYNALRQTLNAIDEGAGVPRLIEPPHQDWVRSVAFHPGGDLIASAGSDGLIYGWSAAGNNEEADRIEGHGEDVVRFVEFDPRGRFVVSVGDDRTLKLWDKDIWGIPAESLPEPDQRALSEGIARGLALSREGRFVALSQEGNTIFVFPTEDTQIPGDTLETGTYTVFALTFSADGERILGGDQYGVVRVWDRETGEPLQELQSHDGRINAITLNRQGNMMATGGEDTAILLWGKDRAGTWAWSDTLRGHDGPITALAFGPSDSRLASASRDGTIRIWNLDRLDEEAPIVLDDHESWVLSIAFSPAGDTLVSGSADRTVRVWQIDPNRLAAMICDRVDPRLGPGVWERLGDDLIPYPNSCSNAAE